MSVWVVNVKAGHHYDVYVGRGGEWGNPFKIGQHGTRSEVIAQYSAWLLTQPQLLCQLPALTSKVLGCYCAPAACHGDVLADLANDPDMWYRLANLVDYDTMRDMLDIIRQWETEHWYAAGNKRCARQIALSRTLNILRLEWNERMYRDWAAWKREHTVTEEAVAYYTSRRL